jgi:hypothetical protein
MFPLKFIVLGYHTTHFTNRPQAIKNAVQKLMENKISIVIEYNGYLQPLEAYQIISSVSLCHGFCVLNSSISDPSKSSDGLRQEKSSLIISSVNLIEITNKMRPCSRIYYSIVS